MSDALLVLVHLPGAPSPDGDLATALRSMDFSADPTGGYRASWRPGEDEPLRALALACARAGATAVLYRPHAASSPGGYQRLWDRTDGLQALVLSWREGAASLPALQPGELLRL